MNNEDNKYEEARLEWENRNSATDYDTITVPKLRGWSDRLMTAVIYIICVSCLGAILLFGYSAFDYFVLGNPNSFYKDALLALIVFMLGVQYLQHDMGGDDLFRQQNSLRADVQFLATMKYLDGKKRKK